MAYEVYTVTKDEIEAYVDAAADVIGLPIAPEHRAGVIANFERTAQFAALVNDFELPESLEPAAIFDLAGFCGSEAEPARPSHEP
jgi:Protein of unknown function (DUF4089)